MAVYGVWKAPVADLANKFDNTAKSSPEFGRRSHVDVLIAAFEALDGDRHEACE